MSNIENYIAKTEFQLHLQAGVKALLVGLAVAVFSMIFSPSTLVSIAMGGLGFFSSGYFLGLFKNLRKDAIRILHERFSGLEFSLELVDKPSRNVAEELQWERVNSSFQGERLGIWYHRIWPFVLVFILAGCAYGLTFWIGMEEKALRSDILILVNEEVSNEPDPPVRMSSATVTISPPAYTEIQATTQSELSISAIKGSEVVWILKMENADQADLELVNSNGQTLPFAQVGGHFELKDRIIGSGIYSLRASRQEKTVYESDFFTLQAIDDQEPLIQPADKELYTYHFSKDPKVISVNAKVSDDFKVREVFLVATLARGSGENVKFRENRIPIAAKNFKSEDISVSLDLNSFDFRQGDEIYYYWAAIDNKSPSPNFSRSDTYFINYVDSTGMTEEELVGMAIHVMPEYFRSQRQIIIDTEKLLAEKKNMSEQEFNSTSNEIGYDQKMLRLRYGQYLGEEFEDNAGGGQTDRDVVENLLEGYEHRHDEEHEAGITANVNLPAHDHSEESHASSESRTDEGDGIGGILDAYLHNHEDGEANTYFEESTKSTLKMALEQMWQSELYLRLFEPEKALPFQEKALEYLKSVQQKSRVYVKRTGFEPPPLKVAEKRLSGDLEELNTKIEKEQREVSLRLEPLAAQVLGMLSKNEVSEADQAIIQRLGEIWTAKMTYSGMEDWSVLLLLQEVKSGKITEAGKKELFQKLYPMIANKAGSTTSFLKQKELEKAFWDKLP